MTLRYLHIILTALLMGLLACSGKNSGQEVPPVPADTLPDGIVSLTDAVRRGDAAAFAARVAYPLERTYPLPDITDSAHMQAYYGTIVDDSLRKVITSASSSDWHAYGWRGYSLHDGEYLWYDEAGIYSIPYESAAEKRLRQSIIDSDMASLPESLRHGYTPDACFAENDGPGYVFRIDRALSDTLADGSARYRLCVYESVKSLGGEPSAIFYGSRRVEGTAAVPHYTFASAHAVTSRHASSARPGISDAAGATVYPYTEDGSPVTVTLTFAGGKTLDIPVEKAYWTTLTPNP